MKLAISGKGGVGKSTLAAALALLAARRGAVLAVDADPACSLAASLGIPPAVRAGIEPISTRRALIEERTGAKVKHYGQMFALNPKVDDIADTCGFRHGDITLLVLGAVEGGGSGCACPESVLLRALVSDVILNRQETLIIDFEAGVEHLGRATARGVDTLLVVAEPGRQSLECALQVRRLAAEIGLKDVRAIANRVASPADETFIRAGLGDLPLFACVPESAALRANDRSGAPVLADLEPATLAAFTGILDRLVTAKST